MFRINTLQSQWSSKTFYVNFPLWPSMKAINFIWRFSSRESNGFKWLRFRHQTSSLNDEFLNFWYGTGSTLKNVENSFDLPWNLCYVISCLLWLRKARKAYILKIYSTWINLSGFLWLILMWPFVYGMKICEGFFFAHAFQTFQFMFGWSMKILLTNHEKSAAVAFLSAIICFLNPSWCSWDIMQN